ncbi:O-antigen ligase family protein [Sphingomicrobium flavum]|uniref:O-antigen ligase family protein n=1 Tax=Sphingomicrobium flavum TaxID=1229164 RepID=UPI0021AE1B83|nr:O-antigen ligase family protein [Sphingomicrobium flavum]
MGNSFTRRLSGQGWDWLHLATVTTLLVALIFGGGGAQGPLNNGIIVMLSVILLAGVLWSHFTGRRPLPTIALWPAILMAGVLGICIFQLTAASDGIWIDVAGRSSERQLLELLGASAARPLSLDTEATNRAFLAFIAPFAILLSAMGATRKQTFTYALLVAAAATIHAMLGLVQASLGFPKHLSFYNDMVLPLPNGAFANANHFGTMMVFGMLAAASAYLLAGRAKRKTPIPLTGKKVDRRALQLLPLFLILVLLVVVADTRAGIALVLTSLPIALAALFRIKPSWKSISLIIVGPLAISIVGLFTNRFDMSDISSDLVTTDDIRFKVLPDLIFTLESFFPWGVGAGAFDGAFRANENLDYVSPYYFNHAHNDWIEWVIEAGVPGIILLGAALLITLALAVRAWIRARDESRDERYLVALGLTAVIVVALHSLVDYPIRMLGISSTLAVFIAIMWRSWSENRPRASEVGKTTKWGVGAVAALVALALSAHTLRLFAAEAAFAEGQPASAIALNPAHGEALAAIAGRMDQSQPDQVDPAIAQARRAIIQRPYTAHAVRALAVGLEQKGLERNAAWPLAASLGWRDPVTQRWAFLQALSVGQFDIAALRADALMRTKKEPENFGETLWQLGSVPDFRDSLIARLSKQPDWRTAWLAKGPSPDDRAIVGALAILNDLAAQRDLSRQEARGTLYRLINTGKFSEALRLRDLIGAAPPSGTLMDDGGFDRPVELYQQKLTPFDWNFRRSTGSFAQVEGRADPRAYIEADGQNGYPLIERMIGLAPGNYRLTFEAEEVNGDISAFSATTICAGGDRLLATMRLEEGENTLDFTVPDGCVITALALTARVSDSYAGALLDNFSLNRAE